MKQYSLAFISTFLIAFVFLFANNVLSKHLIETETLEFTGVRNFYIEVWPKTLKMTGMRKDKKEFPTIDIKDIPEMERPIPKPPIPPWPEIGRTPREPERDKPTIDKPRRPRPDWPEIGRTPREPERDKPTIQFWPTPQGTTRDRPRIGRKPTKRQPEAQTEEEQIQRVPIKTFRNINIPAREEEIR